MPKKKPSASTVLKLTVDGIEYFVNVGQLDGEDALACRKQTGMSVKKVIELFIDDPDEDLIGIFVWLAMRQAGHKAAQLSDTLKKINYDALNTYKAEWVAPEPSQISDDPNDPE